MSEFVFKGSLRTDMGKGASRRLRHKGQIPAVVYGAGQDAVGIILNHNEVLTQFRHNDVYTSIVNVEIDGKAEKAILRDVQRHPFKPLITHLDFLRVKAGEKLKSAIPVVLLNAETAVGVKAGGILTHGLTSVEVECLPKDLPNAIEIDVAALEIGTHITVADIKAPKGVEILTHAEDQIAGIVPRAAEEVEAVAEATEEA